MTTIRSLYVVTIVEDVTGEVVKRFEPTNYRRACKIESGLNDQLDHDNYSVYVGVEK